MCARIAETGLETESRPAPCGIAPGDVGTGGRVEGQEKAFFPCNNGLGGADLRCDPDASASRWYALYVRSRHEKVVEAGLRSKGYKAFSPFYRTRRKRVDRMVGIDVALFPGYVFCQFASK